MKKNLGQVLFTAMLIVAIAIFSISCGKDEVVIPMPTAGFTYQIEESAVPFAIPQKVTFTNTSAELEENATYAWDFGDASGTSTEKNPVYTFSTGGEFSVTLTVSNATDKQSTYSQEVVLTNLLVGTWKMDSEALNTIDTMDVKGAMEFGNRIGWDGTKWLSVGDDGYNTFWSNAIFFGDYFGRTSFFDNEFTFTADGTFERQLVGDQFLFYAGEATLPETDDWVDGNGASLNGWKTKYDMSWALTENSENSQTATLTLTGSTSSIPWFGIYFAGNVDYLATEWTYQVALIDENRMIVAGTSNLFANPDNIYVLKLKRAE